MTCVYTLGRVCTHPTETEAPPTMTAAVTEFVRRAPGHYAATSPTPEAVNGIMWEIVREPVGFGTHRTATVWRTYRNGAPWGYARHLLAYAQQDVRLHLDSEDGQ